MVDFSIERLVPNFILADRNGYAMAKAIEAAMKYFCERCKEGAELLRNSDSMPGWRCDEYAWEMGAEWYDNTVGVEEKRNQIRNIPNVYRKLGTTDSLIEAVESLYGGGSFVREWYEYNGNAYHYSVYVTSEEAYNERRNEFLRLVSIVTSLRSVMDVFQYNGAVSNTKAYTDTAVCGCYTAYTASTTPFSEDTFIIGVGNIGFGRLA